MIHRNCMGESFQDNAWIQVFGAGFPQKASPKFWIRLYLALFKDLIFKAFVMQPGITWASYWDHGAYQFQVNLSLEVSDQARLRPVCSATETS